MELCQRRVDPQGRARRRAARSRLNEQVPGLAPVRRPRRAGERVSRAPPGGPLPVPVARRQDREGARPDGQVRLKALVVAHAVHEAGYREPEASRCRLIHADGTELHHLPGRNWPPSYGRQPLFVDRPSFPLRHSGRSAPRIPERLCGGDWALEDSNPCLEVKSRRERSRTGLRGLAIRRQRAGSQARRAGLVGRQPARVGPLERRTV